MTKTIIDIMIKASKKLERSGAQVNVRTKERIRVVNETASSSPFARK